MVALTHYEALADYAALGAERSLAVLHQHYRSKGVTNAPCLKTLANWSARHEWQAAIAKHERIIGEQLLAQVQRTALETGFDRVDSLLRVAKQALDVALGMRISGSECTAQDVKALADTAINALKMVELLGGSATDRSGKEVGGLGPEAIAILEQIAADKRAGIEMRMPREVDMLPARRN